MGKTTNPCMGSFSQYNQMNMLITHSYQEASFQAILGFIVSHIVLPPRLSSKLIPQIYANLMLILVQVKRLQPYFVICNLFATKLVSLKNLSI